MLKKYFFGAFGRFYNQFSKVPSVPLKYKIRTQFQKISLDREFMQHQSYSGNNILQNTSKLNAI